MDAVISLRASQSQAIVSQLQIKTEKDKTMSARNLILCCCLAAAACTVQAANISYDFTTGGTSALVSAYYTPTSATAFNLTNLRLSDLASIGFAGSINSDNSVSRAPITINLTSPVISA